MVVCSIESFIYLKSGTLCVLGGQSLISNVKRKKLRTVELFINFNGSSEFNNTQHIFVQWLQN